MNAGPLLRQATTEPRSGTAGPERVGAELGLAAALLTVVAIAGLAIPAGPVRLLMLLAFMLVGPGAALVCQLRIGDRLLAWAMAITASLTIAALVTAAMVWAAFWHPTAAFALVAVLTAGSGVVRLAKARSGVPGRYRAQEDTDPTVVGPSASVVGKAEPHPYVTPVLLLVAFATWAVTVAVSDTDQVGFYGMALGLGAPYLGAILLCGLGFGIELFGRARSAVLMAGVALICVIIYATAPLLLNEPEYAWAYKHLGVVELIQQYGRVIDPKDIYQQWPAFFSAVAQLATLADVEPIRFAEWSSLFFSLVDGILLAATLTALTRSKRVVFLAVFLFECCLWVDAYYFSPQAFASALCLGLFAIVLHWCRRLPGPGRTWFGTLRTLLTRGAPEPGPTNLWAMAAAVVVFFALTAAHQLSPYMLLLDLVALAVLGIVSPWLAVALIAVALAYFLPRESGVASQYHLFSGLDLFSNAAGNSEGWGSTPQAFSAVVARTLAIAVWGAAVLGALIHRRRFGAVVIPLALAFSPFVILGVQNYGGEAIYRVFLFSLPWCALIAANWWTGPRRRGLPLGMLTGVVVSVLTWAGVQGLQGQFALHAVPHADVKASEFIATNAPAGSSLTLLAADFPTRLTANYGDLNPGRSVDPGIVDEPTFRRLVLDDSKLPAIETWAAQWGGTETFLVVSDRMVRTVDYFGYLPKGSVEALRKALNDSGDWSVYYRGDGVVIYRLEPSASD